MQTAEQIAANEQAADELGLPHEESDVDPVAWAAAKVRAARSNTIEELQSTIRRVEGERDVLQRWKSEQLQVESEWNEQELAKLLGATLGQSCRKVIQEKVPELIADASALADALEELQSYACDGGHSPSEHNEMMKEVNTAISAFRQKHTKTESPAS